MKSHLKVLFQAKLIALNLPVGPNILVRQLYTSRHTYRKRIISRKVSDWRKYICCYCLEGIYAVISAAEELVGTMPIAGQAPIETTGNRGRGKITETNNTSKSIFRYLFNMTSESYIREITRKILAEDSTNPNLEPIKQSEIDDVLKVCDRAFSEFTGAGLNTNCSTGQSRGRFDSIANWNKSAKLVMNGKIIGYVILSDSETIEGFIKSAKGYGYSISIDEDKLKSIARKKGIEIVSIGILPEYRGGGYGKMLFDFPKNLGADYIWSIQMKGVSNMSKWASKGQVVVSGKSMGQEFYITIQEL